jgi:ribonuclease T2
VEQFMKPPFALIFCVSLFATAGCHGGKNAPAVAKSAQPPATGRLQGRAYIGAQPGVFDYYVFNLSWSPEFCETHPDSRACTARPGFVVHGLWPQNNDGTYPEDCANAARPILPNAYLNLMPTVSLIQHEWAAHGACSGLNPGAYFMEVRAALRSFEIPPMFAASTTPPATVAPEAILDQFRQDNPAFPRASFVLSCKNNHLAAIDACFDKNLNPIACRGIPTCRARTIHITPIDGGQ